MTAAALTAVAGWDIPLLRGAVATLDVVAGRLPAWRARVEAVGRALETAHCWSGPAARSAAGAVLELSGAATAVSAALADSLDAFTCLLAAAAPAQDTAATALAVAAAAGIALDGDGRPAGAVAPPVPAMAPEHAGAVAERAAAAARAGALAAEALEGAALAGAAAVAADRALLPVGVVDAFPPADFAALVLELPAGVVVPAVPAGLRPEGVAGWWAGLSAAEQRAAIAAAPELVGGLDGVPAWARDRANRLLLDRALAHPTGPGAGTAVAVAAEIARQEAAGEQVQLWLLDLDADRVALALGDLDTAEAVGLLVPGILTTPEDDLAGQVGNARDVAAAARAAAPGLAVATVAWLGYRTPHDPVAILTRGHARRGGQALDSALTGLAAARPATGAPDARTVVLAHSYGTVVVGEAAGAAGRLAADAVVLLGSPGLVRTARELEVPEVYDAAAVLDPISWSGWFGGSTWTVGYGAAELPVDVDTLHWEYYDADHPTLAALGEVVAGTRAPATRVPG